MKLWSWLKCLFGKKEEKSSPPISLVFLLKQPRYLGEAMLQECVRRAFDIDLSNVAPDSTNFIVGGDDLPTRVVQFHGNVLMVNNLPMPYFDDKEAAAADVLDLRLRKAVAEHEAWLSVDVLFPPEDGKDPYLAIGKLLAELADEDCLAILAPALGRMASWEPTAEAVLRGPSPLDAVTSPGQVPVIPIADDDPLMIAAVAEARRRWPEFVRAFENRVADENFAVKSPLSEAGHTEFMWLKVTGIEGDAIYGTIDNDPVHFKKLRCGSRVRVPVAELNDWTYGEGKDRRGLFTIEAVNQAIRKSHPS